MQVHEDVRSRLGLLGCRQNKVLSSRIDAVGLFCQGSAGKHRQIQKCQSEQCGQAGSQNPHRQTHSFIGKPRDVSHDHHPLPSHFNISLKMIQVYQILTELSARQPHYSAWEMPNSRISSSR